MPGAEEDGTWGEIVVPLPLDVGVSAEGAFDGASVDEEEDTVPEELASCDSSGTVSLPVWLLPDATVLPSPLSVDEVVEALATGILRFGVGCSRNAAAKTAAMHATARPIFACLV